MRALACVLTLMSGTGCAKGSGGTFCQIAAPITTSLEDSELTLVQIDAHNAAGVALCGWGE